MLPTFILWWQKVEWIKRPNWGRRTDETSRLPMSQWVIIGVLIAGLTLIAPAVHADSVFLDREVKFGRVIAANATSIRFLEGCIDQESQSLSWSDVHQIIFGAACTEHGRPRARIVTGCPDRNSHVFAIQFNDNLSTAYTSRFEINDGIIHFTLSDKQRRLHGPLASVSAITFTFDCPEVTNATFSPPKEFCEEAEQWAVNFSYTPALTNQIFTHGFGFYLEIINSSEITQDERERIADQIHRGFQNAITFWTSGLLTHRAELKGSLGDFVDSLVSRSTRFTLILPPQVIRVGCPHSANFIIKWYQSRPTFFPKDNPMLARAQIQGRTILVNAVDYPCWRATVDDVVQFSDKCLNLTALFGHELGHAFGLPHLDDDKEIPLMSEILSATRPTQLDMRAFIRVLGELIKGERPGLFKAEEESAVRLRPTN